MTKKLSPEHIEKIRLSATGKKASPEAKLKMRISHLGSKNPNFGKRGEQTANWRGGLSYEPYSIDWSKTLKRSIRERDHYTCQICGNQPESLSVHHIDYNKKNCNLNNLITLCLACHCKTNFNRNYWKDMLTKKESGT